MWDEFHKEPFTLKALIFVTINHYLALFSLSRKFKGKVGCVVCLDETSHVYLAASNKLVYMRHRRFLPRGHRYHLFTFLSAITKYGVTIHPQQRH